MQAVASAYQFDYRFFSIFLMNQSVQMNLTSIKFIKEEDIQVHDHKEAKKVQTQVYLQQEKEEVNNFDQALRIKLRRLKEFIDSLGEASVQPINGQLLEQFEIDDEVYQNVDATVVLHEAEKRIQKMSKTHKLKRNWSVCDLKILIWLICKHCQKQNLSLSDLQNHRESWDFIASLIPGTNGQSCLFKWLSLKRYKITLHNWSEEEEQILIDLEKKHAQSRNKWKYISQELYTLNMAENKIYRHPKQCREHYASFLDQNIKKGPWTKEEDILLLANIIENKGEKKWCRLVKILAKRTENAIKNRFQLIYAKLRKRKQNKNKTQLELIAQYVKENGGDLQIIKKQREPAVNNQSQSPKESIQKYEVQKQREVPQWNTQIPIIPSFKFPLGKSSISAFVPFVPQSFDLKKLVFPGFDEIKEEVVKHQEI